MISDGINETNVRMLVFEHYAERSGPINDDYLKDLNISTSTSSFILKLMYLNLYIFV